MYDPTRESATADDALVSRSAPDTFVAAGMTYAQLLHHGCEYLVSEGMGHQQVKNLASALRLWVNAHGFAMDRVIADEFGADFDRQFTRFCDVIEEGRAARTQRDRQEQLIRWRRIAEALRHRDTLPTLFSEALAHCLRVSPLTFQQVARDSGFPVTTLRNWASGKGQPRGSAVSQLSKLEAKGAACEDYDVAVDPSVAPWIDRYLAEARPYLIDAKETDRLLLAGAVGPRKRKSFLDKHGLEENKGWSTNGILHRLKVLTSTHVPDCPGFGPHAFRHIIATDHLRRHPGDYLTVAKTLHDKLETVLKNYGHLGVADGLRVLSSGIQEATAQLAAQRRAA